MTERGVLPGELVEQLYELMVIIVEGRHDINEMFLPGGHVRWRDAERVLREYPATFVLPPQNFLDPVEWIELADGILGRLPLVVIGGGAFGSGSATLCDNCGRWCLGS